MATADRVQDTSTTQGTGNFVLSGSAPIGFRPLSAIPGGIGATFGYVIENGAEWEVGIGTITAANTFSRAPSASSNGNALVNFSAGTKTVYESITAAQFAQYMSAGVAAFSTSIPLTRPGTLFMPQQVIGAVLAFTPAANPVQGALVYLRLVADGTNAPTFTGFKEWGGSLGYDNRAGIANQVQFFYDGVDSWYSITQAVNAVAEPVAATAVTMTGPTTSVVGSASSNFTVGTNGTRPGSVVVTPTPVTNVTFTPSSVTLPAGTSTATFTATSTTTGAKTVAVTNNGGLSNPSNITLTVAAAASAPGAPTIGTASAGDTTMSQAGTAPASDGGSAITGYQLKVYKVSDNSLVGTFTNATLPVSATGLTNGVAVYGKLAATNSVGTGAQSAASNNVTPAAASYARLTGRTHCAESGTGPYTYTGDGTQFQSGAPGGPGGVTTTSLPVSTDGSVAAQNVLAPSTTGAVVAPMLGFSNSATVIPYTSLPYGIYHGGSGSYQVVAAGTIGPANQAGVTAQAGDNLRVRRTAGGIFAEISRSGSPNTWILVHDFGAASTELLYGHVFTGLSTQMTNLTTIGMV